jgi:regulator of protease activity HflC (stomatin/prohibitin superfamily)
LENTSVISFSTVVYIALLVLIVVALKGGIKIVPQSENWLVERLGKFNRKLDAGLHIIIPFFEVIQHKVPIQETQAAT